MTYQNPRGSWAPIALSPSKAANEVVDREVCWAGAKAVAEAKRVARTAAVFMVISVKVSDVQMILCEQCQCEKAVFLKLDRVQVTGREGFAFNFRFRSVCFQMERT
jgi:hypothetical protein